MTRSTRDNLAEVAGPTPPETFPRSAISRPPDTEIHLVELVATLEAARVARLYVEGVLTGWAVPDDLIEAAKLLTSELASNASAPRGALSYPRCSRDELEGGSWV